MDTHPEQGPDEIFVGNTFTKDPDAYAYGMDSRLSKIPSIRLGRQAYYIDGMPIAAAEGIRPIFIHKRDHNLHESIRNAILHEIRTQDRSRWNTQVWLPEVPALTNP